jgi:hypothetical protein
VQPFVPGVLALFMLHSVPAPVTLNDAPLVLNEIMAGPARDWDGNGVFSSRDDEWVEVVNTGVAPLDAGTFLLTDADSIPRFAFSGTIAPGQHVVVYGSASYAWEKATAHPAFGLSLGNSGDEVILWQVTGPDTVVVDRYKFLAHEAAADRSVGRVPGGSGLWKLFDALDPYTGALSPPGSGCAPTPGLPNACDMTPAMPLSWGRLKALYR